MRNLKKSEAAIVADILERVLDSMDEYELDHFSSDESLLISMDKDSLNQCKDALLKLRSA